MKKLLIIIIATLCAFVPHSRQDFDNKAEVLANRLIISAYDFYSDAEFTGRSAPDVDKVLYYSNVKTVDKYKFRKLLTAEENAGSNVRNSECSSAVKDFFAKKKILKCADLISEINRIYDKVGVECDYGQTEKIKFSPDKEIITSLLCDGFFDKYAFSDDGKMWVYTDNTCICFSHDGCPDFILRSLNMNTHNCNLLKCSVADGVLTEKTSNDIIHRVYNTGIFEKKDRLCVYCGPESDMEREVFYVSPSVNEKHRLAFYFDEKIPVSVKIDFCGFNND